MVCVPDGFEYPPPPATFQERVAWALCAHDTKGLEGRLEPEELRVLEAIIAATQRSYGSPRALSQFIGMGGAGAFLKLRRFAMDERAQHDRDFKDGLVIFHMHIIRADWPSYMGAAAAACSVLHERPESAQ
jgi:hypothetical protein